MGATKPSRGTWLLGSATAVGVVAVLLAPALPFPHSAATVTTTPGPSGAVGPRILRPTPAPWPQRLPALVRYDLHEQGLSFMAAARHLRVHGGRSSTSSPATKARIAELERAAQAVSDAELAVAYPPSRSLVPGESPSAAAGPRFTPAAAYAIDLVDDHVMEVVPGSAGPEDPATGVLVVGPLVVVAGGTDVVQFDAQRFELPGTGALTFQRLVGDVVVLHDAHGKTQAVDLTDHAWFTEAQAATLDPRSASGDGLVAALPVGDTVTVSPRQRADLRRLTHVARTATDDLARSKAEKRVEEIWLAVAAAHHTTIRDTRRRDVVTAGLMPTRNNPTPLDRYVATPDAQWNGWVDGHAAVVTAGAAPDASGTAAAAGEVRVVVAGLDGWEAYGMPFRIPSTGALTLESESQGVLTLRDAHGATHRFDLATMRWV